MSLRGDSRTHLKEIRLYLNGIERGLAKFHSRRSCRARNKALEEINRDLGGAMAESEWISSPGREDERVADRLNSLMDEVGKARRKFAKKCVR
jgi:hypothetical protein